MSRNLNETSPGGLVRPGTSGARKHSMSESPTRAMPMGGKIAMRVMVPGLSS